MIFTVPKYSKGFTLIELLVVISIIGLLSSVVLASLASARNKAKVAAFKMELGQLRNLLQLEYSDTNSYAGLAGGWASYNASSSGTITCDQLYAVGTNPSAYVGQANAICKKIIEISGGTYSLYVKAVGGNYSVEGYLYAPDELLYCVGSTGTTDGVPYNNGDSYTHPGCHQTI